MGLVRFANVMADPIPPAAKRFRPSFFWMTIWFFLVGVIGGCVFSSCLIFATTGFHVNWRAYWQAELGGALFAAGCSFIFAAVFYWFFPAWLSVNGIFAHSAMGKRLFVGWQNIEKARTFTVLYLPWLRIYSSTSKKVAWLPLFQSCPAEFKNEIRKLAPPDSPVLKALN
jgi:hypothetical protein